MGEALAQLVDSLLYEGYALYPYTPAATKNATPTPFGIVYPPAYVAENPSTFDRIRMECLADAGPGATVRAEVRFLEAEGDRHRAAERRVEVAPTPLERLIETPVTVPFDFGGVRGHVEVAAHEGDPARVAMYVHNATTVPAGLDRPAALRHSLISTHPLLQIEGGRFRSPLESPDCLSVNTFPVLATRDDDALLGAAIVLPDHPQIAPESRGSLFDATEIEEALLLHVHALSDAEREEIAAGDPAVRAMVERAAAATPEDIMALHGRLMPDPRRGENQVTVEGTTFHKGDRVLLRPTTTDVYDGMLDGRPAKIERIYLDYDEGVHLAVSVEGDPVHELLGETGRYLYFKPTEVELA